MPFGTIFSKNVQQEVATRFRFPELGEFPLPHWTCDELHRGCPRPEIRGATQGLEESTGGKSQRGIGGGRWDVYQNLSEGRTTNAFPAVTPTKAPCVSWVIRYRPRNIRIAFSMTILSSAFRTAGSIAITFGQTFGKGRAENQCVVVRRELQANMRDFCASSVEAQKIEPHAV